MTTPNRSGSNNPNWKGGITTFRNVDDLLGMPSLVRNEVKKRLLQNARRNLATGCWNWIGDLFSNGRPQLTLGVNFLAYRLSFVVFKGRIGSLCVLHTCDNPKCVNPKHLWLGTNKDNSEDMVKKGRQATGDRNGSRIYPERLMRGKDNYKQQHPETSQSESNGRALLTAEQVKEIRKKYRPYINNHKPSNQKQLAVEYGVAKHVIACIVLGKTWRSVV